MKERLLLLVTRYRTEITLFICVVVSTAVGMVGLYVAYKTQAKGEIVKIDSKQEESVQRPHIQEKPTEIWVDVSGAVISPGAYSISDGSRLTDIIEKAGGLSDQADTDFFYRNFNNARRLVDQEKIYIPRFDEVQQGIFVEGRYYIDHALSRGSGSVLTGESSQNESQGNSHGSGKIGINSASLEELDTLSGIGEVTAQKIIDNRPYATLEELVQKKALGQSVFDKVKDLISLD